jgi:hypothetical protein
MYLVISKSDKGNYHVSTSASHCTSVRQEDEQKLIDKVAGKLPKWRGKLLNKTGRLTLINSALSTVVLYQMTVFPLSKWAIKNIDKIRRDFPWHGSEEARGGKCLVNWK